MPLYWSALPIEKAARIVKNIGFCMEPSLRIDSNIEPFLHNHTHQRFHQLFTFVGLIHVFDGAADSIRSLGSHPHSLAALGIALRLNRFLYQLQPPIALRYLFDCLAVTGIPN